MHCPNRLPRPGGGQREGGPPSDFTVSFRGEVGTLGLCSVLGLLVGTSVISLTLPDHPLGGLTGSAFS